MTYESNVKYLLSWNWISENMKGNDMKKINAEWHRKNRMPKNPTIEQRIEWHLEHQKHCNCRSNIPEKLLEEMRKRNIKQK
jgi:hypothetical protein